MHCDPEELSLLALGEPVAVDEVHLRSCPSCRGRLRSLRTVVDAARAPLAHVPPPARVWTRVAAATGVPADPVTAPVLALPASSTRRGRGRWTALAVAAAVGVVAGAGATLLLQQDAVPAREMASARLEPVTSGSEPAQGSASVLERNGVEVLQLTTSGLARAEGGFYQVWLLDGDAQRMVTLGVLAGPEGQFTVPARVDLSQYPLVDISIEPLDGDPAHSGDSVLRGDLTISG